MWTFWPASWATGAHPARSGPAYQGLADGIRMLIIDGRLPVGARLPSERALADALRVSRTTITAAYAQLRDDGYLNARRGARSTTALPLAPAVPAGAAAGLGEPGHRRVVRTGRRHVGGVRRSNAPGDAVSARDRPRFHRARSPACRDRRKILRARASHRTRRSHGDNRRIARDRLDPGDLRTTRRPGPGRATHLSRRTLRDHHRRRTTRPGGGRRRRLGPGRHAGRDAPTGAQPGLSGARQPQPDGLDAT